MVIGVHFYCLLGIEYGFDNQLGTHKIQIDSDLVGSDSIRSDQVSLSPSHSD